MCVYARFSISKLLEVLKILKVIGLRKGGGDFKILKVLKVIGLRKGGGGDFKNFENQKLRLTI